MFSVFASAGDICPSGHYCPEGSYEGQECPPGTFLNTTQNEGRNQRKTLHLFILEFLASITLHFL